MKTITLYELSGLVKDGKAPKRIKYEGRYFKYNEKEQEYIDCDDFRIEIREYMNTEVEILEEEKKLPEKLKKKKTANESFEGKTIYIYKYNEYEIGETINEIIDYLGYLNSKGDE